jgi:hypothetical protein
MRIALTGSRCVYNGYRFRCRKASVHEGAPGIVTFAVVFIVKFPALAVEPDHQRVDRVFVAEESKVTHEIDVVGAPDVVHEEILRGTGIPGGVLRIEGCSEAPTLHVRAAEGTTVVDTIHQARLGQENSFRRLKIY